MDVSLTTDKRVGGSFGLRLRRSLTPLVLALGQHDHVGRLLYKHRNIVLSKITIFGGIVFYAVNLGLELTLRIKA